jgi:hypothetical protein
MVTMEDVYALARTLEASGETISANKIVEHRGGSKREALRLMRLYRAETPEPPPTPAAPVAILEPAMVPADTDPVPAAPEAGPPTLLEAAEEALRQTTAAEHAAHRAYDFAPPLERGLAEEAWVRARRARQQAQDLVDARQRAKARLLAALPEAQIEMRRASGELAVLQAETNRRLVKAEREAALAEEDLSRILDDLAQIAGIVVGAEEAR